MATYKVIQDIEAEDKLVGPLTLKQFVFAMVSAGFMFVAFMIASKTTIFAAIPFLPFILVPAIMAVPLGRDQPTDIWLASQIRFLIKPRKRIWDQSGIKELVTITAPKKQQNNYSDNLSQQEVKSRLKALADTIDSRGWAVKNVNINLYSTPVYTATTTDSDRLIDPSSLPHIVPDTDITASDDIMDAVSNPIAQHFDEMVKSAGSAVRESAIERMKTALKRPTTTAGSQYFNDAIIPDNTTYVPPQASTIDISKAQEQDLLARAKKEHEREKLTRPHHKEILTPAQADASSAALAKEEKAAKQKTATIQNQPANPDIINLANTNDLNVASIAHLANRKDQDNEVVIHLR
jgi:hypothetical protein